MTLPQFLCTMCGELWYGYPVFEGKNDIEYYGPDEKYSEVRLCPKCDTIFYQCGSKMKSYSSSYLRLRLTKSFVARPYK